VAAAVALAVTIPRLLADGEDVANRPKGQVVSRPELGYELVVPSGWRVESGSPGGVVIPAKTLHRPGCADAARPSNLESTSLPIRPGG
jgi:hypothetical protein